MGTTDPNANDDVAKESAFVVGGADCKFKEGDRVLIAHVSARTYAQVHRVMSDSLNAHVGQDHFSCATTLLPEQPNPAQPIMMIISPISHFFLRIARPGSAQMGAGLNSSSAGRRVDPTRPTKGVILDSFTRAI